MFVPFFIFPDITGKSNNYIGIYRFNAIIGKILPGRQGKDCLGTPDHRFYLLSGMAGAAVHILDKAPFPILISRCNKRWVVCFNVPPNDDGCASKKSTVDLRYEKEDDMADIAVYDIKGRIVESVTELFRYDARYGNKRRR